MLSTLFMVLTYLSNTNHANGSVMLIEAYIARALIYRVNKDFDYGLQYPIAKPDGYLTTPNEYLLPSGLKIGRGNSGYYLKSYNKYDIKHLMDAMY